MYCCFSSLLDAFPSEPTAEAVGLVPVARCGAPNAA